MKEVNVSIGLTNPKSPTNVGAVMRAAGCFQADSVHYTGKRYEHAARFHTDTKNHVESIPLVAASCLLEAVPENSRIVCIELVEDAVPLTEFQHPENAFYIFGPEDGTISQEVVDQAHDVVYIPTKSCLNLAATVNVVLYDRLAKSGEFSTDNDLICEARDRNNRVKAKIPQT